LEKKERKKREKREKKAQFREDREKSLDLVRDKKAFCLVRRE
jgi:hypothetical protein